MTKQFERTKQAKIKSIRQKYLADAFYLVISFYLVSFRNLFCKIKNIFLVSLYTVVFFL